MRLGSLVAVFFLLFYSLAKADNTTCISNYADLKEALRDKETGNVPKLLDTFYPRNGSIVHFLDVTYCISESKTECSQPSLRYTFHWADNGLLLVIEPNLLNALTLSFIQFGTSEIGLIISPPFCSNETAILLNTLTTWLKHYATSDDDESDRGYVQFYTKGFEFPVASYLGFPIQILIPFGLMTVVINVFMVLSFRVCSKKMARHIDKIIGKALNVISSGISGESDGEQTPYIETIASPAHNVVYAVIIVLLGLLDLLLFISASSNIYNMWSWLAFLPVPLTAPLVLLVSALIPACIKCCTRGPTHNYSQHNVVSQVATVSLLTVLSVFALFHGFWLAMIFAVYPSLVLSKALLLIPMYLPLLIVYRKLPYFFKKFRQNYRQRKRHGTQNNKEEGKVMLGGLCYVIFVCAVMWPAILILIDYISRYLIIVAQLAEDTLQLIIIVAVVTLITYRLARIFVEVDQEENEEENEEEHEEERKEDNEEEERLHYEPPINEVSGLKYQELNEETVIQMEETTLHAAKGDVGLSIDDETVPIPYEGSDDETMPIPYVLVK